MAGWLHQWPGGSTQVRPGTAARRRRHITPQSSSSCRAEAGRYSVCSMGGTAQRHRQVPARMGEARRGTQRLADVAASRPKDTPSGQRKALPAAWNIGVAFPCPPTSRASPIHRHLKAGWGSPDLRVRNVEALQRRPAPLAGAPRQGVHRVTMELQHSQGRHVGDALWQGRQPTRRDGQVAQLRARVARAGGGRRWEASVSCKASKK